MSHEKVQTARCFMPLGNLERSSCIAPSLVRLRCHTPASKFTYSKPTSRRPLDTKESATCSISVSLMLVVKKFQLLHPRTGVRPTPLSKASEQWHRVKMRSAARCLIESARCAQLD